MAYKVAAATGNWSTAATWNSVTNTPTLHASTNVTIDGTARFTATFTAPNTTNACTGVLLFINAVGSAGTVTVTLQESTVDTAAARTINITALVASTWVYFRFATPYVFTTTSAGAYRFKVQTSGAAGTTNAAADSGGSNYAYLATDDRTGAPGTTDDVWICGQNQSTAITVTMDGTQSIGSGTDTALAVQRTLGNAISINNQGVLAWDTAASATLTCQGNIILNNNLADLQMGTVASPMPSNRIATLRFSMAASGNHGIRVFSNAKLTLQGASKTYYKTKYSSGAGTAANPLILTDPVDWSVGDQLVIAATSNNATNYNEVEYRYIITKNSATSYVVSSTSGGAEAALTHTHTTDAWVLNLQRNVVIDSTNSARAFYINTGLTTDSLVDIDWVYFDVCGHGATSKEGIVVSGNGIVNVDYCAFTRSRNFALYITSTKTALSFSNLVSAGSVGANFNINTAAHNKTLTDCFALDSDANGFTISGIFNLQMTRCYAIACNQLNSAGAGGMVFSGSGTVTGDNCEVHCTRQQGTFFDGLVQSIFSGFLIGTKGTNVADFASNSSGVFNSVVFISPSVGSATLFNNYATMLAGSSVQFQSVNSNSNNHFWYTRYGIARSTGAGLADTTVRTADSLGVRIAPEDTTTGFRWEFLIGIDANSAASVFGFARKNTAFGSSVCTVELFLPGSTVADATATLSNTTEAWQVFNLAASYTGSVASFATIRITAKTTTAAAYVYFDDFYNGTNVLTGLDAWYQGKPTPVMTDLLGDPASVWAILKSTQTTAGTMGYEITQDLDSLQTEVAAVKAYVDDLETRLTANRAGYLDNLSAGAVALQASVDDLEGRLTAARAGYLDNLSAGAVALQSSVDDLEGRLTAARAGYLDNLNIGGNVASAASIVSLAAAVAALNNLSAAQVWDLTDGIETGLTPRQATRLIVAALAGLLSGAGTTTITIKNAVAGNKNRIVATVDSDGNRTAITYDLT